ncbi:MAG: V-type ATP synthase subunit A [Candidatus Micrarchaeota archaeon]
MGELAKISGPLIIASGMRGRQINEVVKVGKQELMGEIIALKGDTASIQVYEDTSGLKPGDKVEGTGAPLEVELGPGLLGGIFDGTQRPLVVISKQTGIFITRGVNITALDKNVKWDFAPTVKTGDSVKAGDVIGEVKEKNILHKIMVPKGVEGKVEEIKEGKFNVEETVAIINGKKIRMRQNWAVRVPRPFKVKKPFDEPLVTGQRILDVFFPIAKGGAAAIPGGFGTGKTITQQSLAKFCHADIIVYIGCGERGNEMTEVLTQFPKLEDPRTGKPLMERTVLIANTSNMPVAAREASIYTGITIAEYFRDMGFNVALMADSTSRWAEALREIAGRLEEMPGEEGYPAYLSRKLAEFYERAGRIDCVSSKPREGSVSIVGAVSPPGGDISEPVSQGTLRITKAFWALDSSLARRRHYPAINWLKSYSLYEPYLEEWYSKNVSPEFSVLRGKAMELLQKEAELQNIVQLIGPDALPEKERLVLDATKMIREDFLQQFAFDSVDASNTLQKQFLMLKTILFYYDKASAALAAEVPFDKIVTLKEKESIAQLKRVPDAEVEKKCGEIMRSLERSLAK